MSYGIVPVRRNVYGPIRQYSFSLYREIVLYYWQPRPVRIYLKRENLYGEGGMTSILCGIDPTTLLANHEPITPLVIERTPHLFWRSTNPPTPLLAIYEPRLRCDNPLRSSLYYRAKKSP